MEFGIKALLNIGVMAGAFTLLTRNMVMKFFLGIWAVGVVVLKFFTDNLAAQFAAQFPNIFWILITPWIMGVPVVIVLWMLKKMFLKGI